ncbi:Transcription repressor OFP17 [Sesamum alatum]|uniref:Transcription repressor OFP17 n=1 Tax=Sesamum alatum TaxID=300844 RepID=A0AAE1XJI2_9LAMI|nr:Transcription repressor OFP17 [Sesamum alatum]
MSLLSFKCKLFRPCKKLLNLFKFRLHKPVFIRALQSRHRRPKVRNTATHEGRIPKILSVLHSLRRKREMDDRITEMKSFSDVENHQKAPHPSPITPAYIRLSGAARKNNVPDQNDDDDDAEDACRSFESYLVEMIVEEGKTRDLVDVEELLYCWKNLRCPVFVDLVSRFYGELCMDLFSNTCENDDGTPKELLR